ncbi:AraC family transcriptional regulator [Yinghuangia seranimata]|uniref:AraC family transcriptional regulator n=1 Tax=Yinghuangia seranimata TaxID=408067 RepID=UPI00248C8010|nr:AraC family transcriptional regulator [Yinghuangia seranimata]MDI2128493.1 AraC family transcriptional regulator ligand-binding domain-containing protein [Yinghuangia seranimata]
MHPHPAHVQRGHAHSGSAAAPEPSGSLDGTVSVHMARFMVNTALTLGIPRGELVGLPGLSALGSADDRHRVPTATVDRMWDLVSALPGRCAGSLLAGRAHMGELHVWDYLFACGSTFVDGCRNAARHLPVLADPDVGMDVAHDGRLLRVSFVIPTERDSAAALERFALGITLRRAREVTGRPVEPVRVAFTGRAPGGSHRHLAEAFGTNLIEFGAPTATITLLDVAERAGARQRLPGHGPQSASRRAPAPGAAAEQRQDALSTILCSYADWLTTAARPAPTWTERFQAAVADALARGDATLRDVADRLAVSPRTLQRQLHDRHTTWRDELDGARRRRALALLHDTDLPLETVARRLAYRDARALRRAFTRWTGTTPAVYRNTFGPSPATAPQPDED